MRFLSVCSGIEAASAAWTPLGWKAVAFSEIEPFPCSVLAHHYPDTPNWGDMTKYKEWPDVSIDLLCGGTPCQSFSVAGLRSGLADPRGNLALTYLAIAAKYRPKWVVWENVPGVFSSVSHDAPDCRPPDIDLDAGNGPRDGEEVVVEDQYEADESHAFACFLAGLSELGYGWSYRVLDAQYFGVAQRRRRVFVVGCLGDWRSAAAVLFERHSLSGHPAPRRQAGKGFTTDAAPSLTASGRGVERTGETRGQDPVVAVPQVAPTLTSGPSSKASHGKKSGTDREVLIPVGTISVATGQAGAEIGADMAPTLNCNHEAPYVAHSLRGEGFDASEDGTGRGTPLVPVGVTIHGTDPTVRKVASYDDVAQCLRARTPGNIDNSSTTVVQQPVPFDTTQVTSAANRSNPKPGDPCHPLAAGAHAPAIAFPANLSATQHASTENLSPSLGAANPTAVAFRDTTDCLTAAYGTKWNGNASADNGSLYAMQAMQVRRLTPEECEKLQGFLPGYTNVPHRGKPAADGPRYKALGNSWAVPVAAWVGKRIAEVEALHGHD